MAENWFFKSNSTENQELLAQFFIFTFDWNLIFKIWNKITGVALFLMLGVPVIFCGKFFTVNVYACRIHNFNNTDEVYYTIASVESDNDKWVSDMVVIKKSKNMKYEQFFIKIHKIWLSFYFKKLELFYFFKKYESFDFFQNSNFFHKFDFSTLFQKFEFFKR